MARAPIVLLIAILRWVAGQQDRDELTYSVQEEVPMGTSIGDVVKDSGLESRHPGSVLKELNFQFLAAPPVNISIGEHNGRLFTSGRLDREYVCPMEKVCVIHLDVAVQPVTYFEIIKVAITLLDLNDNAPAFAESTFALSIKESASVNSSFLLPSAFDFDGGAQSVQRYEVLPDTPKSKFALRVTQKLDGSTDVRLILKRALDRERESSFSIQIVAFDGGGESGSLEVKVTVLDSNDHDPVFGNSTYEVSLAENTPARSMIMRVHATDLDIDENGEVIYGFSSQTEASYGHLFGIDLESGEIYIKQELDHEASPVYNLLVTAQDLGPDSLPADAAVIVHVIDINDNPPMIKVNTLSDSEQSRIKEDSPVDTFVAHVIAKDPDAGNNGVVNCSLNDNSFKLVRRYENEYQVVTAKILDREMSAKYNLAIICKDGGADPLIAIQHLQVNVDDVNDNSPIFGQASYSATLIENSYIGAFIAQVNATDKDEGSNADIKYTLSGDHASFFSISDTGRVTARSSMDHESHENFQLYVNAIDKGSPRRTSSVLIVVTIEDVNDETPTFTDSLFSFSIEENNPSGSYVGQVAAQDRDSPPYNSFLYSMRPGTGVADAFLMDPLTGSLMTKTSLDREEQSVYHLAVIATDQNQQALSSSCSIVIYVMDKNDNKPVFTFPSERNNTVYVSNKIPKDYILTKLVATDADVSRNAMLRYSMLPMHGDQHSGVFSVDPTQGTVVLESDVVSIVDYELYTLNVTAADRGSPPKSTSAILNIVVNKSIPFHDAQSSSEASLSGSNFIIVVSLSSVCGVIAVILIVAIFVIRRQDQTKHQEHKYNCRMEALRTVNTSKHSTIQSDLDSPTKSVSSTQGSFVDLHQINTEDLRHCSHDGSNSFASCSTSPCKDHSKTHGPWVLLHRDYHTKNNMNESEVGSQHSGDGSNTDSGRGASEEGEKQQHSNTRPARLPPYPPPPPARSVTSTYGGHRPPAAPPYPTSPRNSGCDDPRMTSPHRSYHGNGSRATTSHHNAPCLDAIPERTFLPNTLTEMKSVVV